MVDEECSKDFKVNISVDLNQNPSAKVFVIKVTILTNK